MLPQAGAPAQAKPPVRAGELAYERVYVRNTQADGVHLFTSWSRLRRIVSLAPKFLIFFLRLLSQRADGEEMAGGTGQKFTHATVVIAGVASLAATLLSIVYVSQGVPFACARPCC